MRIANITLRPSNQNDSERESSGAHGTLTPNAPPLRTAISVDAKYAVRPAGIRGRSSDAERRRPSQAASGNTRKGSRMTTT
jgi:hypothetical protein